MEFWHFLILWMSLVLWHISRIQFDLMNRHSTHWDSELDWAINNPRCRRCHSGFAWSLSLSRAQHPRKSEDLRIYSFQLTHNQTSFIYSATALWASYIHQEFVERKLSFQMASLRSLYRDYFMTSSRYFFRCLLSFNHFVYHLNFILCIIAICKKWSEKMYWLARALNSFLSVFFAISSETALRRSPSSSVHRQRLGHSQLVSAATEKCWLWVNFVLLETLVFAGCTLSCRYTSLPTIKNLHKTESLRTFFFSAQFEQHCNLRDELASRPAAATARIGSWMQKQQRICIFNSDCLLLLDFFFQILKIQKRQPREQKEKWNFCWKIFLLHEVNEKCVFADLNWNVNEHEQWNFRSFVR